MPNVIVIGAGVMGAAAAFRLAAAGADVLVLEAGRVGGGTSGISFAWTNAHNKPPQPYHDLNVLGMKAHAALRAEFGTTPWWHGGGSIEWEAEQARAAQAANVERLQSWGYAAEWITLKQLQELEPDIDPAIVSDAPIAYFPDEGWLDPVPYAHAMIAAARRHGARLICGARVTEIVLAGERVRGVRMADGTRHEADVVVNCAGRWVNEPMMDTGLHLPLAPTVGLLVFTPPVASSLARVVRTPLVHLRPDGAGRVMLIDARSTTLPPDTRATTELPQARELTARVRQVLPCIGEVRAEAVRIAVRPMPADRFSAIGPVPRLQGYYLAITHSGVTLSPFLGQAIADEIVQGHACPALAPFRPARFFN